MSNIFTAIIVKVLKNLIGDPDALLDFIVKIASALQEAAKATSTAIDDLAVSIILLTGNDPEIRELFRRMWGGLLLHQKSFMTATEEDQHELVAADGDVVAYCQAVGGRLNIDWQKLLDLILQYLPLILPIFLDDGEPEATSAE